MIAQKGFYLNCGDFDVEKQKHSVCFSIKKGDDVSTLDLEEKYLINLKTEGVIVNFQPKVDKKEKNRGI